MDFSFRLCYYMLTRLTWICVKEFNWRAYFVRCIQVSCDWWHIVEKQSRQPARRADRLSCKQGAVAVRGQHLWSSTGEPTTPRPPIGQLANLCRHLIGRHRCGVAKAAIPTLRALSLSRREIRRQMSSFYLPSSQLPRFDPWQTWVGKYPWS